MNENEGWETQFEEEIQQAMTARFANNEGMARVCARRAVSIVIAEYLKRLGMPYSGQSVQDRIRMFQSLPYITPEMREISEHFLVRVDTEYKLPIEVDLVSEANQLRRQLLQE
jgi:hypothetical protein